MEFKKFDKEKMEEELQNEIYNLVYINYEKEKGIKAFKNEGNALNLLDEEDFKDFYKIYIFNEEFMKTIYKFGDNDFRYCETRTENIKKTRERRFLIDYENFSGVDIIIGNLGDTDKEVVQFIRFTGGEKNVREGNKYE